MTQSDRIKNLRKNYLHMTLEQFGERIGVTKMTISRIENGVNAVTDHMLKSICREFNVSELWLREGEGDPFLKMDTDDMVMESVGRILADSPESFRRRVISMLCQLKPEEWELLEKMCRNAFGDPENEKD